MIPSTDKLAEIRRELERQQHEFSALAGCLDLDQLERMARLSDGVLEQLDTIVGNFPRARRPAVPVIGIRA